MKIKNLTNPYSGSWFYSSSAMFLIMYEFQTHEALDSALNYTPYWRRRITIPLNWGNWFDSAAVYLIKLFTLVIIQEFISCITDLLLIIQFILLLHSISYILQHLFKETERRKVFTQFSYSSPYYYLVFCQ